MDLFLNYNDIANDKKSIDHLWTESEQFKELCNLFISVEPEEKNECQPFTREDTQEIRELSAPRKVNKQAKVATIKQQAYTTPHDKFVVRSIRNIPINQRPLQSVSDKEDENFEKLCKDTTVLINPVKIGFIPSTFWNDEDIMFGNLVFDFFRRKNNPNCRFHHKLYNALKIAQSFPALKDYVGVEWLSPKIIKVNKFQFSRLLAIGSIDGSLFHKQGNFPTHGFVQASNQQIIDAVGEARFEELNIGANKILIHKDGSFTEGSKESSLNKCRWFGMRK